MRGGFWYGSTTTRSLLAAACRSRTFCVNRSCMRSQRRNSPMRTASTSDSAISAILHRLHRSPHRGIESFVVSTILVQHPHLNIPSGCILLRVDRVGRTHSHHLAGCLLATHNNVNRFTRLDRRVLGGKDYFQPNGFQQEYIIGTVSLALPCGTPPEQAYQWHILRHHHTIIIKLNIA
jgi:hypothetical protein